MAVPSTPHSALDHDELLVARLVVGDLEDREATLARARIVECAACALVFKDLRAIRSATAGLPPARRPRDFRLTTEDAARLRQTGLRRLLGWLGSPQAAFTQPVAAGLVALGIVGVLVSSLSGGFGSAAAAPRAADQALGSGGGAYLAPGSNSSAEGGAPMAAGPSSAGTTTAVAPNAGATAAPVAIPGGPVATAGPKGPVVPAAGPTNGRDITGTPVEPSVAGDGAIGAKTVASGAPAPAVAPEPSGNAEVTATLEFSSLPVVLLVSIVSVLAGLGLLLLRLAAHRAS